MTDSKETVVGRVEAFQGADHILIYEALRFYFWAAGQGMLSDAAQDCLEPEEAFWQFSIRTGDQDWETIAERYRVPTPSPDTGEEEL